jgi:sulfhydrogenase subunit beta (sulfur reductase)
MAAKIIHKKEIVNFLDDVIKDYEVFAPVKREGLVRFAKIENGREALLDCRNHKISPKGILFPQSELLFNYRSEGDTVAVELPSTEERPYLIFGVHPCDAMSLAMVEKVFDGKYKDPYYLQRKSKTVVVSIGCPEPPTTCFCTSVGGGPFSSTGSDLLFIDIGDDYVVQIVSDKGQKLLKGRAPGDADKGELSLMNDVKKRAKSAMGVSVETEGLKEKLDSLFDDPIWADLTEKCLGCGLCTYLCPTCHCFDILDESAGMEGKRIRIWDSCLFPLFTLQASWENSRPNVKERYRQRIMHKFNYLVKEHGVMGCSGCGRCVTECPVNLDIRQVLNTIQHTGVAQ